MRTVRLLATLTGCMWVLSLLPCLLDMVPGSYYINLIRIVVPTYIELTEQSCCTAKACCSEQSHFLPQHAWEKAGVTGLEK